jgi:hypothetical protein
MQSIVCNAGTAKSILWLCWHQAIKTKGTMADPAPKQVTILDFVQPLGYSKKCHWYVTRTRLDGFVLSGPFLGGAAPDKVPPWYRISMSWAPTGYLNESVA